VNTRPDIAFVDGYMSRFLEDPQEDHLATMKQIVRNVAGTNNWGLWFNWKKVNQMMLIKFNNADFVGDVDVRKSTMRSSSSW
jgi:hypothetical protein